MKTLMFLLLSLFVVSCSNMGKKQKQGTAVGAASGGAIGAVLGNKGGKSTQGAAVGAAAGGVLGNVLGKRMDQQA